MATSPAGSRCRATVWMNSGLVGSVSICGRSRLTCTSTARSLTVPPPPASATPRHSLAGRGRQHGQHFALAVGQANDPPRHGAAQRARYDRGTVPNRTDSACGAEGGLARLKNVGDAQ